MAGAVAFSVAASGCGGRPRAGGAEEVSPALAASSPAATAGTPGPALPAAHRTPAATPESLAADDVPGLKRKLPDELPCVVEFVDPDCASCKQLRPIVLDLTDRFAGRLRVFVVDIRSSTRLGREYGISFTPTFMAFAPGGRPVARELVSSPAQLAFLFEKWAAPGAEAPEAAETPGG